MTIPAGHRVGRFEVAAELGRGGMGEVYRARDTRLGRDVALKVLSASMTGDRLAVGRFEQEARAASALSHPNIVAIYDVGEEDGHPFIVTELLEGQTLREKLATAGRLTVDEAVSIVVSAAAGLGAAHAAGIVHRDVKPENIFLAGKRGQVKLLDFGIARLSAGAIEPPLVTSTPTAIATAAGALIGTPGYMSPEQAKGDAVDARSDIFSLGCVLYELLAGTRAFGRRTALETIAAIVSDPPAPLPRSANVPGALVRVLERALEKDPADRFQTMDDFAFAVRNAADAPAIAPDAPATRRPRFWPWLAPLIIAAGALAAWLLFRPERTPRAPAFALEASVVVAASARPISPVISRDGTWVAYIGLANPEAAHVYVQFLNGAPPVNLTGGQNLVVQRRTIVGRLEISPDSRYLIVPGPVTPRGLFQLTGIWTVPAPAGGAATRLTDKYASLAVSNDGRQYAGVIANPLEGDGIGIMAADGSSDRVLLQMRGREHVHQLAWSPDDRYIYYVFTVTPNHRRGDIYRIPVAGGEPEAIVRTPGTAMFPSPTPDGKAIVYAGNHHGEGMNLWWHPLDGSPEQRLTVGAGEYTEPSVSREGGSLVCIARRRREGLIRIAADVTDGTPEELPGSAAGDTHPSIPRDAKRLYVSSTRTGERRIWSMDLDGTNAMPLTTGSVAEDQPVVSPDGRAVAFISDRDGQRGIWVVASEGSTPHLVEHTEVVDTLSWSRDSRRLVYIAGGEGRAELRILDVESRRSEAIRGATGRVPAWSPTQDVIAVVRATNGVATAHFISPAGAEQRAPVPIASVGSPLSIAWSPDGQRLALINLPGRNLAEVWVLDLRSAELHRVVGLPAPSDLSGATWSPDGRSLILGRVEFDNEVLLIEGLPKL